MYFVLDRFVDDHNVGSMALIKLRGCTTTIHRYRIGIDFFLWIWGIGSASMSLGSEEAALVN